MKRTCSCGCNQPLTGSSRQRYASIACKQAAYRQRVQAQRAARGPALAASLREAAAGRDLAELFGRLLEDAQRAPQTIVLRVAGRLHALTLSELQQVQGALAARTTP